MIGKIKHTYDLVGYVGAQIREVVQENFRSASVKSRKSYNCIKGLVGIVNPTLLETQTKISIAIQQS